MPEVLGEIDYCHATATDLSLDRVTVGKRSSETLQLAGHEDGSSVSTGLSYGSWLEWARLACQTVYDALALRICVIHQDLRSCCEATKLRVSAGGLTGPAA